MQIPKVSITGKSLFIVAVTIFRIWYVLKKRDLKSNFHWLYSRPDWKASFVHRLLVGQNPNHLGDWSDPAAKPYLITQKIEKEVILFIQKLLHAEQEDLRGYMTTGASEGNIFCAWLGREYLTQRHGFNKDKIVLIYNDLTHYSVTKAARITGIKTYLAPLSPKNWNFDLQGFEDTVTKLQSKGIQGFIIPLTVGYTETGTCDEYQIWDSLLTKLEKKLNVFFYVWIDAASDGFIRPFLDEKFAPFSSTFVHGIVIDFHKFGKVPYGSGLVLYRSYLTSYFSNDIAYLPESDSTLLGSRSGVHAVAIWSQLCSKGIDGYKNFFISQQQKKIDLMSKIHQEKSHYQLVTSKYSLTFATYFLADQKTGSKNRDIGFTERKLQFFGQNRRFFQKIKLTKWYIQK